MEFLSHHCKRTIFQPVSGTTWSYAFARCSTLLSYLVQKKNLLKLQLEKNILRDETAIQFDLLG